MYLDGESYHTEFFKSSIRVSPWTPFGINYKKNNPAYFLLFSVLLLSQMHVREVPTVYNVRQIIWYRHEDSYKAYYTNILIFLMLLFLCL